MRRKRDPPGSRKYTRPPSRCTVQLLGIATEKPVESVCRSKPAGTAAPVDRVGWVVAFVDRLGGTEVDEGALLGGLLLFVEAVGVVRGAGVLATTVGAAPGV
ncbi:hypothetical protein GCM10009554_76080 [Kribbella koreensis]|uniref:Uncharacterized protein n=1 Tax=Kribbella koreensis TaxID=57909 RepID=A0ABP4C7E6_9ACTN